MNKNQPVEPTLSRKSCNSLKSFCSKYWVPLLLATALIPTVFAVIMLAYAHPIGYTSIASHYYFVGFEFGFGGRKLLGTLFHWLLPAYATWSDLRPYIIGLNFLTILLFVVFAGMLFARLGGGSKKGGLLLLLCYMVGPYSIIGMVDSWISITFPEIWHFMLTLLWLLLYLASPRRWYYYLATLAIATTAILIHHTYCCTFFPLMAGLMLYDSFSDCRIEWKRAIPYGLIALGLFALFACLWLFSGMNISKEDLWTLLESRASNDVNTVYDYALTEYYYSSNYENWLHAYTSNPVTWKIKLLEFVFSTILMSPLFALMLWPWISVARKQTEARAKWFYLAVGLAPTLLTLPVFVMAADYGRFWIAYSLTLFAQPLAVAAQGDRRMNDALAEMWNRFTRNPLVLVALAIYLSQLAPSTPPEYGVGLGLQWGLDLQNMVIPRPE